MKDGGWWLDYIDLKMGEGYSTLFRIDPYLNGMSLEERFSKMLALAENKNATIAEMNELGVWGEWRGVKVA